MNRILITGANSYVGDHVGNWLKQRGKKVDIIDMINQSWRQVDFSLYEVVFHVAGLAHRRITKDNEASYYSINYELAVEVANKAKEQGVHLFVFMSSMSVYSDAEKKIDKNTPTNPDNAYGKSKLMAEKALLTLNDAFFHVAIIRPPMIYGKGCKGNYTSLRKISLAIKVFPKVKNQKSMIYIDNLSEFVFMLIENDMEGIFFPQNSEYVNTSIWAKLIAEYNGKTIRLSSVLGWCVSLGIHLPFIGKRLRKAFGDSYYDIAQDSINFDYQVVSFRKSVELTET